MAQETEQTGARAATETPNGRREAPDDPTDLKAGSWGAVLKRTFREFKEDNLTDWAAALTYYGVLAIFPALIALVSILGLVGSSATQPLLDNLDQVAPGPAKEILTSAIQNLQNEPGRGRLALRRRPRRRAVVRVGLRRRVHARVELDLRHRARGVRSGRPCPCASA